MSKKVKELMIEELAQHYGDIHETGCVVVDYRGLSAQEAVEVRSSLRKQNAEFRVVKNNLLSRALERQGLQGVRDLFTGTCAIITAEDPVTTAKISTETIKKLGKMQVRGGVADQRVLDPARVEDLAKMPSLDQLRSQVIGLIAGPMTSLVRTINAVPRKLVSTVGAVRDKKQEPEGG